MSVKICTTLSFLLLLSSLSVNDGVQHAPPLPPNFGNPVFGDEFEVSAWTRVYAVRGVNVNPDCSGILISVETDTYNFTTNDIHWKCTTNAPPGWEMTGFDDSDWPMAVANGNNINDADECGRDYVTIVHPDALWIWTTGYLGFDVVVSCRGHTNICDASPCKNGGTCLEIGPDICACHSRWQGEICDVPYSDCDSQTCNNFGTCEDLADGGYQCHCDVTHTGPDCETDISACASAPCLNGASCDAVDGGYQCECVPGFTGSNCETNNNECENVQCFNGGTCVDLVNDFRCDCALGYTGVVCQTLINLCESNPCVNGATCQSSPGRYDCLCLPGYAGQLCETATGVCISNPCLNSGTCYEDADGGPLCLCNPDHTGANCETSTDYCTSNPCQNEGTCVNYDGGFYCDCTPIYAGTLCSIVAPHCGSVLRPADYPPGRGFWSLCWITKDDTAYLDTPCRELIADINIYGNWSEIIRLGGSFGCYATNTPSILGNNACLPNYQNGVTLAPCLSCTHLGVCIQEPTSKPESSLSPENSAPAPGGVGRRQLPGLAKTGRK